MNVLVKDDPTVTGCKKDCRLNFVSHGFTILELMITIVIIGILTTVSIPSMRDWVVSNRVKSKADDIVSLFDMARTSAIEMGKPVYLSGRSTNNDNLFVSPHWDFEVASFVDTNQNGAFDNGEELGFISAQKTSISLVPGLNNANFGVVFLPNGMSGYTAGAGNRFIQDRNDVVINVCAENGNVFTVATININVTGVVNINTNDAQDNNPCL